MSSWTVKEIECCRCGALLADTPEAKVAHDDFHRYLKAMRWPWPLSILRARS